MFNSRLSDLPAIELEDLLDRILVEPQKVRHRAVIEGGLILDPGLYRLHKIRSHFGGIALVGLE